MTAYETIKNLNDNIDEESFYRLIAKFRSDYLKERQYVERVSVHRKPDELQHEILSQSYAYLRSIGERNEMKQLETLDGKTGYAYVYTKIRILWESDKRLKSLYNTIRWYCTQTSSSFITIAVHMAEFRAIEKVGAIIRKDMRKKRTYCTLSQKAANYFEQNISPQSWVVPGQS